MKFDISTLLVKSKEHDSKINTNVSDISSNLSKIETNETNISSNLSEINTNESDISSNLELINTNKSNITNNYNITQINKKKSDFNTLSDNNKNNISDNLELIDTNVSDISDNLELINTNKSNITNNYNISQINKKKSEFNTTSIDNDINNINSIKNDIENYYKLKDIIIIDIIKSNIPETIDINNNEFVITQYSLNNLKKDSYLQFDSSILIFFNKHYINIGFFHMLLEYFNDKNLLIESIKMPIIGMISRYANITNSCIIKIPNDFDVIYYKLSIKLNDNQNRSDSISILDFDNKIYLKYFEKNLDYSI